MSAADARAAVVLAARCIADLHALTPLHGVALAEDLAVMGAGEDPREADANMVSKWISLYVAARELPPETRPKFTEAEAIAHAVALSKLEIIDEILTGTIDTDVSTFSELHDYVDANEFGGLCDTDPLFPWLADGEDAPEHDAVNKIQNAVDAWLRARRPTDDTDAPAPAPEAVAGRVERAAQVSDAGTGDTFTATEWATGDWVSLEIRDADGDYRRMLVTPVQWAAFLATATS